MNIYYFTGSKLCNIHGLMVHILQIGWVDASRLHTGIFALLTSVHVQSHEVVTAETPERSSSFQNVPTATMQMIENSLCCN